MLVRPLLWVAALLCLYPCTGFAATLIYDDDGSTGNGITDGVSAGWNASSAVFYNGSTDAAWTNSTSDIAQFGGGTSGTAGALAVGSVSTNGILFATPFAGSYTLTGGSIALGGTTPTLTADASAAIASLLTGTAGFTKLGAGTLTLTGNSTGLKGTVNLNAGILSVVDTTTGSGTLIKALGNSSNPLMLNGGTLQVLANGDGIASTTAQTLTFGAYNTTVTADSTIMVDHASGSVATNKLISMGTLSIGASTLTITDGNSYGVRFGTTTLTGDTTFNVTNVNVSLAALTLTSIASTTNSITKTGTGSMAINGGTFGDLTINTGNVDLGGTGHMGDVTVSGSANFTSHSGDTWTMNSLTYNSTGSSNFNAASSNSTYTIGTGGFSMTGGSITVYATNADVTTKVILQSDVTITGTASLSIRSADLGNRLLDLNGDNRIFTISSGAIFTVAPVVQNGGVDKEGAGTLKFTNVNTYSGGTTIGGGTLQLTGSGTLGDITADLTLNGGTLDLGGTSQTVNNFSGTTGTVTNSISTAARLIINGAGVYSGAIINGTGTVALTKNGSGTLSLTSSPTGSNTYSGGTTVNGGILLGTDTTAYSGSPTTNKLFGTGAITMADGTTLQVRADGDGTTTAQTLSYANTMTLAGSVTVDINRNISSTAKTKTIAFGSLNMADSTLNVVGGNSYVLRYNTLTLTGTADLNVGSGVTLLLNSSVVGGANAITKDGVGTLTLQGGGTYGDFIINAGLADIYGTNHTGNVTVSGSASIGTHSGDHWDMTSLTYNSSGNSSFNAYSADSVYTIGTGGLSMSKGTLQLVTTNTSPPPIPVNDTLLLQGDVTITGTSSITTTGPGNAVVDLNSETRSFNVSSGATFTVTPIIQNGALTKTGDGTMAVSGASTYGGGTTISQGTFLANNTAGSATGTGAVSITGGTLGGTGFISPGIGSSVTISGTGSINPGGVTSDLSGTLTLSSDLLMDTSAGGTPSIHMDIDGKSASQLDRLVGIDSITLGGTITVAFAGSFIGSTLIIGDSFDLIDWTTVNAAGFNVGTDLVLPDISTFDLSWDTSHFLDAGSAGGVISVISYVPEPSRAALLALALGMLCMRRRRGA